MKNLTTLLFFFLILSQKPVFGQNKINNYKYVSVPDRFVFLKSADQYQVNSLTKFLLKKNGFLVLDPSLDYPNDLSANRCLLLDVNVEKIKGFLKTKLEVQFRNCKNEIIFKSEIGVSKLKDYKSAYHEALRAAFESIAELNYRFKAPVLSQPRDTSSASKSVDISAPSAPPKTTLESRPPPPPPVTVQEMSHITIAPTPFGFRVFDEVSGQVFHTLHTTIYDGIFIIDNLPGIAYKRGNRWVREYVSNQKIVIELLLK
jgi:hypothetical protein